MDFNHSAFNKPYSSNHTKITPASATNGLNLGYNEVVEKDVLFDDTAINGSYAADDYVEESIDETLIYDGSKDLKQDFDEEDVVRIRNEELSNDDFEKYKEKSVIDDDSSSSIEGLPYSRENMGNPRFKNQKAMSEVTFGTEFVAKELGVSSQAIRNYVEDYNEFLNIETSPTGRRLFRQDQIEKLRNIMQIKTERGYTTARMQAYLRDPDNEKRVASPEERMEEMFGQLQLAMQQSMMETMRTFAGELLDNNTKFLEMKESMNTKVVDELKEQVLDQGKAISELLDLVKNQTMDDKKYDESLRIIEDLKTSIQQKDKNLEELTATIKKQQEEYEHLQKTTRKKIFGLF